MHGAGLRGLRTPEEVGTLRGLSINQVLGLGGSNGEAIAEQAAAEGAQASTTESEHAPAAEAESAPAGESEQAAEAPAPAEGGEGA